MPLYLSRYIAAGTPSDPYAPVGSRRTGSPSSARSGRPGSICGLGAGAAHARRCGDPGHHRRHPQRSAARPPREGATRAAAGGVTGKGFLPGRSGNSGGRPKRLAKLVEWIQQQTRDGEDLVDFMLKTFRNGPMRYRMEAAHWLTTGTAARAP
jgi:hypothetical protein